jgi:hypothetical protein
MQVPYPTAVSPNGFGKYPMNVSIPSGIGITPARSGNNGGNGHRDVGDVTAFIDTLMRMHTG